ncbi:VirK protein [Legionella geestiana]|uniref:VirK protein n=1 Tax=Legionella geestiana TaxID=45065 RepID=A0A0W0U556_9GAMM|nr:hypothetical protein [Legionella geestiana]KTD03187.1 VirK protein [Legionella geestiana]QBS12242.1 hypothetical protein E4T54_05490 [Legionella geestiana]QDQ40046.1 hypothetical protein E3226_006350 [Legionella geestiana]STX53025.1 VirK protein [Legionella geestiana]
MKKPLLLMLFLAGASHAEQLFDYQQAVAAVKSGKKITYVVDWNKCTLNLPNITPDIISSYSPDHVIMDKQGFMGSRGTKYTHEISKAPELGPVHQSFVYTFTKEGELQVVNRFLDPITYAEKMPAIRAVCRLHDGFEVFAN